MHEIVSLDGHEVYALKDRFPVTITDVELYKHLGRAGEWVVISKDVAQAKRPPERAAILSSGVVAIFLAPAVEKLPPHQQAATILWQWGAIVRQRETQANGLFLLPINKGSQFKSL
ncbi:hypothetical protein [Roseovarius mucosus]|uniref:PIN-like domain-containing protein n=1 Tax=Roseovarius mucosus TaxID=215743 RepID=UPI003F71E78F